MPLHIALLGTGVMGSAITARLLQRGLPVTVWNRSRGKALALEARGARVAHSPAAAVQDASVLISMVADSAATQEIMTGAQGALAGMRADARPVWLQMATVGAQGGEELWSLAHHHGVPYLEAPVVGTKEPAERGELVILVGGPAKLRQAVEPVLEALSRKVIWTERPGEVNRIKLLINKWIIDLYESLAETFALAQALDCDPRLVVDALEGGPTWAPAASYRASLITRGEFDQTSFSIKHALKDSDLILNVATEVAAHVPFTTAVRGQLARAMAQGLADSDIAALYLTLRPDPEAEEV